MVRLEDIKSVMERQITKPQSLKIAICENCGENPDRLYLCERHGNLFCYDCLKRSIERNTGNYFIVKCKGKGDCIFNPLGKKSWEI